MQSIWVASSVRRLLTSCAAPPLRRSTVVAKQSQERRASWKPSLMHGRVARTALGQVSSIGSCDRAMCLGMGESFSSFHMGRPALWKVADPSGEGHLCGSKEGNITDVHENHPEEYRHSDSRIQSAVIQHDLSGADEPAEGFVREFYKDKTVGFTAYASRRHAARERVAVKFINNSTAGAHDWFLGVCWEVRA